MYYPFSMLDRIIQIHRFCVSYVEQLTKVKNGAILTDDIQRVQHCHAQEEADALAERTGGSIAVLDTAAYDWLDGIEVADVPDTYAAAVEIYEMGREAWERRAAFEESKKADQLRADLDYVMLMGGL